MSAEIPTPAPSVSGIAPDIVPVIAAEKLSKRFGPVVAVDAVDFTIAPGSTVGLLGGNGAGKTTTLSMLLGLLLPSGGSVRVFGEDMARHRYRVLRKMNFSSPYVDMPKRLSVLQNLTVYAHLYGLDRVKERVRAVCAALNVDDLLKRELGTLSAGQKTRVSIAKALLNEPALLLLDEPTASLDPDTADWVRGYLESYRDAHGMTIVLASHNMGEVERLCDRIIMMRAGRIVDDGTPAALLARYGRHNLEDVFLDIARNRQNGSAPGGAASAAVQ
ncbi:MAG: ABC transporter ATP-binding protein [Rhodospirillales bacterium]